MRIKFSHKTDEAKDICSFWFEAPFPVRYEAGQFVEIIIPHAHSDSRGTRRWFTLSSSPTEEMLAITTRLSVDAPSTFKQALVSLKPGEEIMMSEPMGDFVLPKDKEIPLLFVAGGVGITPVRSMVRFLIDKNEQRKMTLVYAARNHQDLAFLSLFNDYGTDLRILLSQPSRDGSGHKVGTLNADHIIGPTELSDETLIYLSGPEPMTESLYRQLTDRGVSRHLLVTDYFPGYSAY